MRTFTYSAEIRDEGMATPCRMPLLGIPRIANYQVAADRQSIFAELLCDWGRESEHTQRISVPAQRAAGTYSR
jgi:hypothetical protein